MLIQRVAFSLGSWKYWNSGAFQVEGNHDARGDRRLCRLEVRLRQLSEQRPRPGEGKRLDAFGKPILDIFQHVPRFDSLTRFCDRRARLCDSHSISLSAGERSRSLDESMLSLQPV